MKFVYVSFISAAFTTFMATGASADTPCASGTRANLGIPNDPTIVCTEVEVDDQYEHTLAIKIDCTEVDMGEETASSEFCFDLTPGGQHGP